MLVAEPILSSRAPLDDSTEPALHSAPPLTLFVPACAGWPSQGRSHPRPSDAASCGSGA